MKDEHHCNTCGETLVVLVEQPNKVVFCRACTMKSFDDAKRAVEQVAAAFAALGKWLDQYWGGGK